MVIEEMTSVEVDMYGLTFDLDTHMLEEEYQTSCSWVNGEIEKKLLSLDFDQVQYNVYFYGAPKQGAMDFAFLVLRIFSHFRYAPAIRNLQGFEVKNRSVLTEEIIDGFNLSEAAGQQDSMWPKR
ncbi:MAG: hypothetical protein RRX88_06540 [Raoultibacter sp.]